MWWLSLPLCVFAFAILPFAFAAEHPPLALEHLKTEAFFKEHIAGSYELIEGRLVPSKWLIGCILQELEDQRTLFQPIGSSEISQGLCVISGVELGEQFQLSACVALRVVNDGHFVATTTCGESRSLPGFRIPAALEYEQYLNAIDEHGFVPPLDPAQQPVLSIRRHALSGEPEAGTREFFDRYIKEHYIFADGRLLSTTSLRKRLPHVLRGTLSHVDQNRVVLSQARPLLTGIILQEPFAAALLDSTVDLVLGQDLTLTNMVFAGTFADCALRSGDRIRVPTFTGAGDQRTTTPVSYTQYLALCERDRSRVDQLAVGTVRFDTKAEEPVPGSLAYYSMHVARRFSLIVGQMQRVYGPEFGIPQIENSVGTVIGSVVKDLSPTRILLRRQVKQPTGLERFDLLAVDKSEDSRYDPGQSITFIVTPAGTIEHDGTDIPLLTAVRTMTFEEYIEVFEAENASAENEVSEESSSQDEDAEESAPPPAEATPPPSLDAQLPADQQ